ncbi:MAG TPA: hypothetical protein GX707_08575 [Epulopiscium sp.]|nr:hypothetical protein [Candidatus Epulonipiscium sp.]
MRRKYGRSYTSFKNQMPQILICSIFIMGVVIGSLFSNTLDSSIDSGAFETSQLVNGFIVNINLNGLSNSYLLGRSILTYGKQVALIWLFGLFPATIPLIGLLVGVQGFSYGFTTSFFVMEYNLNGVLLCLAAYGIQGTLFVIVMFLLSIEAFRFAKKDMAVSPKMYLLYLLVAIGAVIMIALYESYIAPVIIQEIITTFF